MRWIWLLGLVASCGGKSAANKAAAGELRGKLANFRACLANKATGDFTTAVVVNIDSAGYRGLDCRAPNKAVVSALTDLGKRNDVPTRIGELPEPLTLDQVEDLCHYVDELESAVNAVIGPGEAPAPAPSCDPKPHTTQLLTAPPDLLETDRYPRFKHRDGELVAFAQPSSSSKNQLVARTSDGVAWDVRTTPKEVQTFDWSKQGLVGITWPSHGQRQLQLDDGKHGWTPGAKITAEGVSSIWMSDHERVTVVGFEREADDQRTIRRSTDGGKTIGQPIAVIDEKTLDATTSVRADGTVIVVGGTRTGPAHFEAVMVGPDNNKPKTTAMLKWPESGDVAFAIAVCSDADTYWALARRRHLVLSTDAGASWREVADLGTELEFARLSCTADRAVIWNRVDTNGRSLRSCTRDHCSKAIDVPVTDTTLLGVRLQPRPELWISSTALGPQQTHHPFAITVKRIDETALVTDRIVLVMNGERSIPVVFDAGQFLELYAALGIGAY